MVDGKDDGEVCLWMLDGAVAAGQYGDGMRSRVEKIQYSRLEHSVPRILVWEYIEWNEDVDGQRDDVSLRQNSAQRDTNKDEDRKCYRNR